MPGFVLSALAKPLPAVALAVYALGTRRRGSRWLAGGLLAAALGDEFLLVPSGTRFLLGMLCFALMHLAYITAFAAHGTRHRVSRLAFLAYGAVLIVMNVLLAPHTGPLGLPVIVYSLLLVTMATRALAMPRATALGAALFVVSDATLAFHTFIPSFPLSPRTSDLFILGTYYAAQVLITWGMTNATIQDATHDQTLAEEGARHV